jgi:surface carbohydrate biosynthesis protein (TIGR04326 family)
LIKQQIDIVNLIVENLTPEPNDGCLVLWKSFAQGDQKLSIPLYINENENRLRGKYLSFIAGLGEQRHGNRTLKSYFKLKNGYNVWWMSLLVEKNLVKSPNISDCLKLFALEEILQDLTPNRLRIFTTDYKLFQTVKHLCNELKIDLCEHVGEFDFSHRYKLKNILSGLVAGLLYILKNSLKHWPLRRLRRFKWHSSNEQLFIFSHFINVYSKDKDNADVYSKYWEILPELLKSKGVSINFLNTFFISNEVPNVETAISWLTRINTSTNKNFQRHIYYYSFLNFTLIFDVLVQFFVVHFRGLRLGNMAKFFRPEQSHLNFWPILKNDWNDSMKGTVLSENLLLIALIDKAVSELQEQKLGLYLQENNGWERAFIHAWKRYQSSPLIGVSHTTVRYWDLRYFEDVRLFECSKECKPRPDFIAVNGPIAKRMLTESGYLQNEIIEVEALRYLQADVNADQKGTREMENRQVVSVLLCGDIDPNSTIQMLNCVEKALLIMKSNHDDLKINFVFKSHPITKVDLSKFDLPELVETDNSLNDILSSFDIMIATDSTSAGVEAYLAGLKVIVFIYSQRVNLSPLKGVDGVLFVRNEQSLSKILLSEDLLYNNVKPEPFFWTDKKLPKWSKIFKDAGYSNFN